MKHTHILSNSLKQTNRNNDINNNADFKNTYPAAQRAEQYKHNRTFTVYIKAMMTLYQLTVENVDCQWKDKSKSLMCLGLAAWSNSLFGYNLQDVEQTCWESFIAGQSLLYESFQGWVDQWQIFVVECTNPERWGGADHGGQLPVASLRHNNPVVIAAERYGSILAYNSVVSCELSCLMFYCARFCCNNVFLCYCKFENAVASIFDHLWILIAVLMAIRNRRKAENGYFEKI